jgi:hypothetical protein
VGGFRVKAEITKIGFVAEDGTLQGFCFDCKGEVPGIEVKEDGEVLYGGWTGDELKRMILENDHTT